MCSTGKKERGFTLIELMITISILSLVTAIAVPNVAKYANVGEEEVFETNKRSFQMAVDLYSLEQGDDYPTPTGGAGPIDFSKLVAEGYITEIPESSIFNGGEYLWEINAQGNVITTINDTVSFNQVINLPFDEGIGPIAHDVSYDLSGFRMNDGTIINNSVWVTGMVGSALQLDGENLVNCGNDAIFDITNEITVEVWLSPSDTGWDYVRPITLSAATTVPEYQVKVELSPATFNYAQAQADGADLRFYDADGNALDYWIETWDASGTSIIWVKVTEVGTTTFDMYYGNASASEQSDIASTFSYSEPRIVGYIVADRIVSNSISIMSLCDDNIIQIGSYEFELDEQETATIPADSVNVGDPVKVKGLAQVEGTGDVDDMIVPVSWAGTQFIYGGMRDAADGFCMVSPFGDASVQIYDGGVLEWSGTVDSAGATITNDITTANAARVESDLPILVFHRGGSRDGWAFYPATTETLYVPSRSNSIFVGVGAGGASISCTGNGGGTDNNNILADLRVGVAGSITKAKHGSGSAVKIITDAPIGALQQADSDGSESTVGVPVGEMTTKFGSALAAEYIVMVTPYADAECTLYNSVGDIVSTDTAVGNNEVYQMGFGCGDSTQLVGGGWKVESNRPVWAYYEEDAQGDETNVLGYKQMRQYVGSDPIASIGDEFETEMLISKGSAYGVGTTSTTAFAYIDDQVLSAAIVAGWNHIVMTYDKDAGGSAEMKLYVNGVEQDSADYSDSIATNTYDLVITAFCGGLVDEMRIYNTALSEEEVLERYNETN
ncbi:MAG: DUF2341 domain-containing protein [Chloroflexota bacterium]|nr:DUF2341 domain-containing protein [Chloroflexota bacterium]